MADDIQSTVGSSEATLPGGTSSGAAVRPFGALRLVVFGPNQVDSCPLPVSGVVTIGRSSDSDVAIVDGQISRRHARIEIREGAGAELMLIDEGSSNGTKLR